MTAISNDLVVEAYRKYLNRSPEPAGFTYWVDRVDTLFREGTTTNVVSETLKTEFTNSPEYKALNPTT